LLPLQCLNTLQLAAHLLILLSGTFGQSHDVLRALSLSGRLDAKRHVCHRRETGHRVGWS
jgi:hypothetical protein